MAPYLSAAVSWPRGSGVLENAIEDRGDEKEPRDSTPPQERRTETDAKGAHVEKLTVFARVRYATESMRPHTEGMSHDGLSSWVY